MKNLFSYQRPFDQFSTVVKRDSLSVLSSLIAYGFFVFMIELNYTDASSLHRLANTGILAASSGISLFLAIRLWSRSEKEKWLLSALGVLFILGFSVWHWQMGEIRVFRMTQWLVLTHLLVALAPLRDRRSLSLEENDSRMWSFNWYVFSRFIFGGLFCIAMALGLSGAMAAVEKLFGVDFVSDDYSRVNGFVFFVVSVFQVLSTIRDTKVEPQSKQVTLDLRRLIQYLLTPLSLIYFSIAYAYILKIAIRQSWPQGVVGLLISALIGVVFLTYLLQRPLSKVSAFPAWMSSFWRWSFPLSIPPVIVLLMAIWRRVAEYGLTESRVTAAILALWALAICIYYFNPARRAIAAIPLSLTVVGVITFAGPLSPHFISYRSQVNQLHKVIAAGEGKLVGGKYEWPGPLTDYYRNRRTSQILSYICREFEPAAMFDALKVSVPEGIEGYEKWSQCTPNSAKGSPIDVALETLGIQGAPTQPPREKAAVDFEDGRDYGFRAGDVEMARIAIGNYTNKTKRGYGSNLRFTYECCGTVMTWHPAKGKPMDIDVEPLLREKEKVLVVKGEGGTLKLYLVKARTSEKDGKLELTRDLDFDAIFAPGPTAEREEITY